MNHLRSLGVGAGHLKDWEKLITMRYEEFARDRHDVRAAAMEMKSAEKPLDLEDLYCLFNCSFRFKPWPSAVFIMFAGETPGITTNYSH